MSSSSAAAETAAAGDAGSLSIEAGHDSSFSFELGVEEQQPPQKQQDDMSADSAAVSPLLQRRTAVRRFPCVSLRCCFQALSTGALGVAAFFGVAHVLDDGILWTKYGATRVAPPLVLLVILVTSVASEVACCCAARRSHRQREQQARRGRTSLAASSLGQYCAALACGVLLGVAIVWLSRAVSGANLDDVNPAGCGFFAQYVRRSNAKFLWVIPVHDGVNISSNGSWCSEMMRLQSDGGFILGMHGVRHAPQPDGRREFEGLSLDAARERLDEGVAVWRAAFGAAPTHFSFPGEWATPSVAALVRNEYGMAVRTLVDGLLHRIYHCDDTFCGDAAFMCRDWSVDWF